MDIIRILSAVLIAGTTTYWGYRIMTKLSDFAAQLLASVSAQTSVVASFVAFSQGQSQTITGLQQQLRTALEAGNTEEALSTLEQLETAQQQITDNTGSLARAMAVNTDSAAEVPQEHGGIGTSDTVVEPESVVLEPVDGAGASGTGTGGEGGSAGSGTDAAERAGDGDGGGGGEQQGGTQTGAGDGSGDEGQLSGGPGREGTAEAADGAGHADTGQGSGGVTGTDTDIGRGQASSD